MNPALAIAEQMLVDRLMSNKAPLTGESKAKLALLVFSGVMGSAALGFAIYALYLWLSTSFTPLTTMLGMAGAMGLLSLIAIALFFGVSKLKRRIIKQKRDEIIKLAEDALKVINHEASEPIKENPLTSTLIATFAGFIIGDRFL